MDAKPWVGDDERDTLSPDAEERCPSCGVLAEDDCEPDCGCRYCERARERRYDGDRPTAAERASVEREQMVAARRLK